MQPHEIKIRCSSLGYVMTEPKEKSPYAKWEETKVALGQAKAAYEAIANKETATAKKKLESITRMESEMPELEANKNEVLLSDTCRGHLADIMVRAKYGRQTEVYNRYLMKGNMVEEDSITLYSRVTKRFFKKNEEQLQNAYISGTPDMFTGLAVRNADTVIDIKSSWDIFTFFRQHENKLNATYYWQMQGYMWLTGAKTSTLAYCLIDTPKSLIYDECRKLFYKMNALNEDDPEYIAACEELEKNMTYEDIPLKERLIEIEIHRDDAAIERIEKRIKECREYMQKKYPALFEPSVILATSIPEGLLIS